MYKTSGLKFHRVKRDDLYKIDLKKVSDLKDLTSVYYISPKIAYATQKTGKIYILEFLSNTNITSKLFLDIKEIEPRFSDNSSEEGLLCVIFSRKGEMYLSYTISPTDETNTKTILIVQKFFEGSSTEVFRLGFPEVYHHSGTIAFDRYETLFLSTGDGGPQGDPDGHAQDLKDLKGKILQLKENPIGTSAEVIAYGLRNPWKFSIDEYQRMFIGDVGQSTVESIYLLEDLYPKKPYNLGWNEYEGSVAYKDSPSINFGDTLPPIFEYRNDSNGEYTPGRCVIAGYAIHKDLFIFGDHVSGYIYIIKNEKSSEDSENIWVQVSSQSTPENNHIYSLSKSPKGDTYVNGSKGIFKIDIFQ